MNVDEEVERLVTGNTFKAAGKLRKASSKNARSRTCRFISMMFTVFLGSFAGSFIATGGLPDGFHLENITKDKNVTTSLPHVRKSKHERAQEKGKVSKEVEVSDEDGHVSKGHKEVEEGGEDVEKELPKMPEGSNSKSLLERKMDSLIKKSGVNIDDFDIAELKIVRKRPDFVNPNSTVGQIVLIGERNTGTRWISRLLASCFPDIYVSTYLSRWKHWFQYDDGLEHPRTLVVTTLLNPYDWAENMRVVPHDQPEHMNLHWKEFLTKPWTMPRPLKDASIEVSDERVCQAKFRFNEVVPCKLDEDVELRMKQKAIIAYINNGKDTMPKRNRLTDIHQTNTRKAGAGTRTPLYELNIDGSGKPYDSILDMRADKIANHLSVKEFSWIEDVIPLQYESVVEEGPMNFLQKVESIVGVKAQCSNLPPAKSLANDDLPLEMIQYINEHANWEVEASIGYKKRDV